ncbi:MAG TPA: MFS transporter, partial [Pseudomonas sp.]|nr:MFS transporter [Pseudomonas sp.]
SDRLVRRAAHWQLTIPIIGHLTAMAALATYLLWPDTVLLHLGSLPVPTAMLWCAVYSFFSVWWVAPSYNLVTQLVPADRRGTAMALQTIVSTLLGIGVGPLLAGVLSDMLLPLAGQDSLRYALVLVSLPVLGAVYLLLRTSRQVIEGR